MNVYRIFLCPAEMFIPIETKIVPLKQNASRCYWNKKIRF